MNETPNLSIPQQHLEPLRKLARLSDSEFSMFAKAMESPIDSLDHDVIADRLVRDLAGLDVGDSSALIRAAASILSAAQIHDWNVEETGNQVAGDGELGISEEESSVLGGRLARLLKTDLARVLVAVGSGYAALMPLHTGEVVTSVRLIYGDDGTPAAAISEAVLVLQYHGDKGAETVRVALDTQDMRVLVKSLQRGIEDLKMQDDFFSSMGILTV